MGSYTKWGKMPGFVPWFKQNAPLLTNDELSLALVAKFKVDPVSTNRLTRLRDEYEGNQSPDTKRRAYAVRDNAVTKIGEMVPSFVRELGPADKDYFVHVTGDCFITSDWHIPHHKELLVDRLCQMSEAWRVTASAST